MNAVSGLMESLASRMALPEELLPGTARLTLTGGDQVRIENQKCLLSFSPEMIEVGCGRLRLRVLGSGMELRGMDRDELLICGSISSVEVEGS